MSEDELSPIGFYRVLRPILFALPPELAHRAALMALRLGASHARSAPDDSRLSIQIWGRHFPNPIGLAAGFDKDAEAWRAALGLGFGFVEVGSVTPEPQPGNPKPRLFRLKKDGAIINRMGFNSAGMAVARGRLRGRPAVAGVLGINLGKNRETADASADYVAGAKELGALADYLVINVSSPNTPGLRALQGRDAVGELASRIRKALGEAGVTAPLLLKIAPDLAPEDLADIAEVTSAGAFDGIIIGNTTIARPPGIDPDLAREAGGLSGLPLFQRSNTVLREIYGLTGGRVPLIGVGGIASGADAYAKIRAGASLVQLYTALVYRGPGIVERIKRDLLVALEGDGFSTLAKAVGADCRPSN